MLIKSLRIRNFRSIEQLDLELDDTTVFIGANNAGKSAILEALRIALTRRWGQRGTGFTAHDVFAAAPDLDPKTLPPVSIEIELRDTAEAPWPDDLVQDLNDIVTTRPDGRNVIILCISCAWNETEEAFEPNWQFLNFDRTPLGGKAQRNINFSNFFDYLPLHWLSALRDAEDAFSPRSQLWGRLVKSVRIPRTTESEVQIALDALDAKILAADPKLGEFAGTIGQATTIAVGESPGGARLRMLPLNVLDLLMRAGIVVRHEDQRPWLPLDHHGQGLQSLAVLFLFQAAVKEQLASSSRLGIAPVYAIEEPEAHLHPQAARTLWQRLSILAGQKLVTTHSPYFVQHVPLHNLRIVRLVNGRTVIAMLPRSVVSNSRWNDRVGKVADKSSGRIVKDTESGCVSATTWLGDGLLNSLIGCWKGDADEQERRDDIQRLRHSARMLITADEEQELGTLGRRVRGEIFFARRWALVEGVCEYVLLHAIGRGIGWSLDEHGVAVIDFQNNGNASIYPSLATAFGIPWRMVTDGDAESVKFRTQLLERGFSDGEISAHVSTLSQPNTLEHQLIADGHGVLLRELLIARGVKATDIASDTELLTKLQARKTEYIHDLAGQVIYNRSLAEQMPAPLIALVHWLQTNTP